MQLNQRYQQAKKISIWGGVSNLLQGIFKVIVGLYGNSHALFADGLHSFADLLTDGLVVVASRYGSKDADANHPYGHQRFETAASMLLSFLLIIVGASISYDSLLDLHLKNYLRPSWVVIILAGISVVVNEVLYHYTKRVGHNIKSDLVIANAWHHRSDAASSAVVLLGAIGALLGFFYLDRIAAIIVGILIVKMGTSLVWTSVLELVDTAVKPELLKEIRKIINSVPGVLEIHQLRTRSMGHAILVDVHILVDKQISVSEGHHIAQQVHYTLLTEIKDIRDVTVHVDPENDEITNANIDLPTRQQLIPELEKLWSNLADFAAPSKIIFHYLSGQVLIDLYFNYSQINHQKSLKEYEQKYKDLLKTIPQIMEVKVFFEV